MQGAYPNCNETAGDRRDREDDRVEKEPQIPPHRRSSLFWLLHLVVCASPPPAAAQAQITMPVEVLPGPPDLAALCSASKNYVEGDSKDSADITITVQNLLTPPQYPYVYTGKVQLLGSEASPAQFTVELPKPLSLIGNSIGPPGFCAPYTSEIWGCGGANTSTIPAGGSTKIDFRVT